jgi:hypothetical protein
MQSIQEDMNDFRKQLGTGSIQKAYRALLDYIMRLRTHFEKRCPGCSITAVYQGYMDMTYFAIVPPLFRQRGLKIATVFNYEAFRFDAWLAATNRQIQRKYWELFRTSTWNEYRVVTPAKGVDSIIECTLAEDFDFTDRDSLTAIIEERVIAFINDLETFLLDREEAR